MLGSEYRYATVLPESIRQLSIRVRIDGDLIELPFPARFSEGRWFRADTGDLIDTVHIWQWREWRWYGHDGPQTGRQQPGATRKHQALERVVAADVPPKRDWYARPRTVPEGELGTKMAEAMKAKIRASLLSHRTR